MWTAPTSAMIEKISMQALGLVVQNVCGGANGILPLVSGSSESKSARKKSNTLGAERFNNDANYKTVTVLTSSHRISISRIVMSVLDV